MTHTKHTRHFEIGEFVVFDHVDGETPSDADIREVIGYTPEGLAFLIYPSGHMGIFKSLKEAREHTGCIPRRCTLAGMVAWQAVYAERCRDLTGIDDLGLTAPAQNPLLHFAPLPERQPKEKTV